VYIVSGVAPPAVMNVAEAVPAYTIDGDGGYAESLSIDIRRFSTRQAILSISEHIPLLTFDREAMHSFPSLSKFKHPLLGIRAASNSEILRDNRTSAKATLPPSPEPNLKSRVRPLPLPLQRLMLSSLNMFLEQRDFFPILSKSTNSSTANCKHFLF